MSALISRGPARGSAKNATTLVGKDRNGDKMGQLAPRVEERIGDSTDETPLAAPIPATVI